MRAAINLERICEFIEKDSPEAAARFVADALELIESIPEAPLRGPMVPEYGDPQLRERLFRRKYRIVYRVTDKAVTILAITHGARLLENVFEEDISAEDESDGE